MTKIFLLDDATSQAKVWFEAADSSNSTKYALNSLYISTPDINEGKLIFSKPIDDIPAQILESHGNDKKLKTWEQAVESVQNESRRHAAAALDKLYQDLRKCAIRVDGGSQDGVVANFLGITGIAQADTEFHIEINPIGLLPSAVDDDKRPIFRAVALASFEGAFNSPFTGNQSTKAVVRIEVIMTRESALKLLPRVEVPELPHFGFTFPELDLKRWSLDDLEFNELNCEFFQLPFQESLNAEVAWGDPKPTANFSIENGQLKLVTNPSTLTISLNNAPILTAQKVVLTVQGESVEISATNIVGQRNNISIGNINLDNAFGPLLVKLSSINVDVEVEALPDPVNQVNLVVTLNIGHILIQARTDPSLVLALAATVTLTYKNGVLTPVLDKLEIVEPYPIKLTLVAAHVIDDGTRRLLSVIQKIPVPSTPSTPDLPSVEALRAVLKRIAALATAAATWLAQQGIAAARTLAGLAEAVLKLLGEVIAELADKIKEIGEYVIVEVRIDMNRRRVVQIVVTPSDPKASTDRFTRSLLGFKLDVPYGFSPALVCDFDENWMAIVLQTKADDVKDVTLSTDLWLENDKTGTTEPVSGSENAKPVDEPLLTLTVKRKKGGQDNDRGIAIALAGVENGKAFFLKELETHPSETDVVGKEGTIVANGHLVLAANFATLKSISSNNFEIKSDFKTDRILTLFRSAGPSADNSSRDSDKQFSQYMKIVGVGEPKNLFPIVKVPIDIEIKISDKIVQTTVTLELNLETLSVKLNAGRFGINLKENKFELLGLKGNFVSKNEKLPELILDLSDGDPRLSLNEEVRLNLAYDKLSNGGEGLGFSVDQFVVSRDGIDLTANVMNDKAVTLTGVDMPFRFDHGQLSIKRSQIQTFTITGHGNLPPTLVGEAKASIELNFAQGNNRLIVQAAKAVLDKTADPLRCESTQFSITVTKLGLKFVEQDGYHFYFTLTGAAEFRPNSGAFADGLLKNLSSLNIVLNEAPLASDPRVLLKHVEFLVPVDPPKRSSFFDLFSFELRGVGFHPASDAFGGSPAFSISGQVNFTDFGDIVTPRFDFHKLWIAPPENGQILPRIRFDGLGVGLALGSMAEASGTAIAVDGKLPSLLKHDALTDKEDVTAKGFLASGSLRIQGWASMSASMGFLELEKPGINDKRHAFFIYLQRNDMAEKIPTPIGTIFLREVGFGFGYRYTLAGIAAADKAETPRELIKVLDEISKYQGSLDDVRAWLPTFDNAALTLALRGLLSITSASSTTEYNEKGEKDLPNLILFDIVAALRTDLTFLMNVRAWVAYNYADWREARQKNSAWRNNPNLTGYMYLSAPRREFLARAVSNPGAEVGNHPDLPKQLKDAMKVVRWSSTLYVRPGLFHWEAGWPYELGFSIGKPEEKFYLVAEGGTVMRFEESAVLYGLAFRARGFAKFDYSTGGSFGAAISARAEFALGAKLIAYLSTNMSESMFYGVITLDVTVVFAVRMWLKTKWFKLSTSFSQSLTIHVGIELLLESSHLAARIEASVSVGAFGRTLSVGIGFTLGDIARLDMARLRVERFLSLGLASSYPDPEAGVPVSRPAPLPEPSRGDNASKSDHRTENAADRVERTKGSEQDEEDLLKIVGREFGDVHYWALLFPIRSAGESTHYLVQLIPCDASFGCDDDLLNASHFYAAPKIIDNTHTYSVSGVSECEIFSKAPPQKVQKDGKDYWEIFTDWAAPFGFHGAGENARERATLKEVFEFGCFMAGLGCVKDGDTTICDFDLTDIETIPWDKDEILPDDPEQASIKLKEAARSRTECGPRWKRILQIDEARSCFIATVADCAERLAGMVSINPNNGTPTIGEDKEPEKLEFDPRAIGLTFVLKKDRVEDLFRLKKNPGTLEPPVSDCGPDFPEPFKIETRIPKGTEQKYSNPTPVRLFNPPERMFHQLSPVLKYSPEEQRTSAKGILLHWDLEPRWTSSKSIYSDPEYHLKHYRIERRIEGLIAEPGPGLRIAVPPPRMFEVKKSDPIEIVLARDSNGQFLLDKNGQKQLHKRRYRSRLQFADDLQDLDEKLRAQLLTPVNSDDRSLVKKGKNGFIGKNTRIVYSVLPVDCCGTYGVPEPDIVIPIKKREEPQKGLLKAIARFQYENVPDFDKTFNPQLVNFLQFTIEEEEKQLDKIDHDKSPELEEASNFQLRIRSERTVAVGVFGVDALSQARAEPPVPGREERQPSTGDIDVTLNIVTKCEQGNCEKELVSFKHKFLIKITRIPRRLIVGATSGNVLDEKEETALYSISTRDWEKLQDALDISSSARVQAARLYIRPQPKSAETATEQHHLDPEWVPVQLQMQFFPKTTDTKPQIEIKEPAFDITVERFEHPLDVNFHALTSGNIFPSSGRLYLYHPAPCATLQDFIAVNKNNVETVIPLRDGDRRTAVTLAWNARPADIGLGLIKKEGKDATKNASDLHSLIAGYDLFALDATAVPKNAKDHPDWPERFITPIGRVQRLPAAERGQEPSETGDFARIEVLYPSETRRLNTASSG
ncbi:MAG: hypothetical protein JNL77_13415, partial [Nitrosomonas sp.]|nr:hypothetical protein [Nitrosomonas sp.]